ncbi:MAG TPA: NAD(P)H-binding protein [Vicinamibacterales bacterium]|nr:NAD(P)H-binding protein [Vicinamibacterales bacterium]
MNIAITGANSSVGLILLRHLAERGDIQVVACVRSALAVPNLPVSPSISARAVDYADRDGLAATLSGAACLVHLAGILFENPVSSYQTANVDATQAVVDACRKAGVRRIVLVSVLGADPMSPNRYLRSKGRGERIVLESGLSGAIIRTGILLGPGMAGARAVVQAASQPAVTLLGGGRHSIRPLDVDDLSRAIVRCCEGSGPGLILYELVGPEPAAYRDVVARTAAMMNRRVSIRSLPIWLARLGAAVSGWRRRSGMTPTIIDVITASEVVHENADAALGVHLTPLSATLEKLLSSQIKVAHP